MVFKSKYSFSNQCYNDIMKLIIDLIPPKYNMTKDLYQSIKIVPGLGINYEKIDGYEKNSCCFGRSIRMIPNVSIAVDPDMGR
jgi:NADPH-dependent 7-cyano-7-deazaguanine reductase QueF